MNVTFDGVCAVFGGSFDPLTQAHERIIYAAVRELGAGRGILIPCSDEYIISHKGYTPMFSADARLSCLNAAFGNDPRFTVDAREIRAHDPDGRSLATLRELKSELPRARFIFVTGADKLTTLPRWGNGTFLSEFEAAVCPRGGEPLSALPERVIALSCVPGIAGISAGRVRAALRNGESIESMVSAPVLKVIRDGRQ